MMNDSTLQTIDQIEAVLSGAGQVDFFYDNTPARYAWMTAALRRLGYLGLPTSLMLFSVNVGPASRI